MIDTTDQAIWDHLAAGDVLDVFQFSTGVGLAIAKRLKPQNPMEMTAANAMMRLMSEKAKNHSKIDIIVFNIQVLKYLMMK